MSAYPLELHDISVLVELILGHQNPTLTLRHPNTPLLPPEQRGSLVKSLFYSCDFGVSRNSARLEELLRCIQMHLLLCCIYYYWYHYQYVIKFIVGSVQGLLYCCIYPLKVCSGD